MATLKGQNFRLGKLTNGDFSVYSMATNCTVTLGTNTEDANTKDDVSAASKPEVLSKNWSVQVESLDVTDMASILTTIKNMESFDIMFDEVSTTDNQNPLAAAFSRTGKVYINDATFAFNDRENSTKNVQMTGTGELSTLSGSPDYTTVTSPGYTKGQYVRLFLGSDNTTTPSKVIAAAKQLSLHISVTLEDATTKDTTGDWQVQEPTGISWDISSNALMRSGETISSSVDGQDMAAVQSVYEAGTPVKFQIANTAGDNNRTKGTVIMSGSVIVSQLVMNAPNRQNATYDTTLSGYGDYTVGS